MTHEAQILAESKSAEALNAEVVAAEARERAQQAERDAARAEMTQMFSEALREAFGEQRSKGRFVDISRIPLICKNIEAIDVKLEKIITTMEDNYVKVETAKVLADKVASLSDDRKWIVRLVVGAVITALLGLVLIK